MKTSKKLTIFLSVLVVSICFVQAGFAQNSISGTVRYSDNNELVTTGMVKAYDLNGTQVGQANIQSNGTYLCTGLPSIEVDIIGLANIEPDYIPTFYPDQINPLNAQSIYVSGTVTNRNIYVERIGGGNAPFGDAFVSGKISFNGKPVKDVVVYAQVEGQINHFAITSEDGTYEIENLSEGDYILVVHRIGYNSVNEQIQLRSGSRMSSNFELLPLAHNIAQNSPNNFRLSQNYPNPFNPSTVINYNIPVSGNVKLSVYNTAGQVVKELVNQFQNSGTYNVTLDGTNLSSGIYFYKLESNGFINTKRMTLVK